MNDLVSVKEYISAANRLIAYSQNEKFHIKNNKFNTKENDYSLYLNDVIRRNIGIDIFEENTFENIQKYEIELNKLLSDFITKRVTKRDILDEVDMQRNSKLVNRAFLLKIHLEVSDTLDVFLEQLPISKKELLDAAKKPINIQEYSVKKSSSIQYLLNTEIKINNNIFNVVMHLRNEDSKPNKLFIMSVFIVSKSFSEKYVDNPVRLFLACLDNYGISLIINGKIKKIFALERIEGDAEFLEAFNFLSFAEEAPEQYTILTSVTYENKNTMIADFTYGINDTKYMKHMQELLEI